MNDPAATAPTTSPRWRPTRAGLVSLWRYWDETFTFHRGRLLLRGPNGSGKSMALELLVPFLLDGDANPARLTSAAKPRGRLFDRVMTGTDDASRTGFAWVEFRHGDDAFTVGARMRASQATGKVDVDLFTTTRIVGRDLHLLDETRTPLSRKALVDAIGSTGRVHDSADEHRAAVRETLFPGFDADRYQSVIAALLALRKEKLSQNLDLDKLSDVLSDALPPIDEHDIATVAEGFERLDRRRAELAALERELDEVHQLDRRQRDYARAVVVGTAREVGSAEYQRDKVTRNERQARDALDAARQRAEATTSERAQVSARTETISVDIEALKDTDAYRAGANLADLRNAAAQARRYAAQAARTERDRQERQGTAEAEVDDAGAEHQTAAQNLERAERDLGEMASRVGAEGAVTDARAIDDPDEADHFLRAWVSARRSLIADVLGAVDAHDRAVAARRTAEERVADDETALERRTTDLDAAGAKASAARTAYHAAINGWVDASHAVDRAALRAAVAPVLDQPAAVEAAIAAIVAEARADEATRREQLRAQRSSLDAARRELETERRRWEQPDLAEPAAPPWRSDRSGRAGAPLWRIVDIADGVEAAAVDGLESALAAMGVVDAWVQPDGRVELGPDRADLVLTSRPADGRTLASLLVPAADASGRGVPAAVVAAVLASIPVTEANAAADARDVVVGVDGTFRLGSAAGRATVQAATLLGAAARERHRLDRLAELDVALHALDLQIADIDRETASLDRARVALDAELAAVPSGSYLIEARNVVDRAAARVDESRERLAADREQLRDAEDAVRNALRTLTALASRHGLPSERGALVDVESALSRLAEAISAWARRRREQSGTARQLARARDRAATAALDLADASAAREGSERDATEAERRVLTLESAVGAEYSEILSRIAELTAERDTTRQRTKQLDQELLQLASTTGTLAEKVKAAAREREEAEERREVAQRRLVDSVDALALDAALDVPSTLDTATEILGAGRAIAAAHESVDTDDRAIERFSERVNERVHQARAILGGHIDLDRELTDDGWWILRTTAAGIRRRAPELAAALAAQLDEGKRELLAEEERLFEQTLAGSVRRALADRIRQANALVDDINQQLSEVKTVAGGVQVRLRWDVDTEQPTVVKDARGLLLRDPADLSDAERNSLQDFVRARVDQARAELEVTASWDARLRETLDYRSWHRFTLQLGHRDWQGLQPATPRRLQKLSTGERSIALHLPMIASLAAHYTDKDGQPSGCPRLILLDELFAGVDATNRAQLFGTFTTWDLDAVFTSDHEWCQYSTLDGIAIHHLHPPTGDEPVTSTRFTWDGRRRAIAPAA